MTPSAIRKNLEAPSSIAKHYAEFSQEYITLGNAAMALAYLVDNPDALKELNKILSDDEDLTDEQKAHLRSMGIEP